MAFVIKFVKGVRNHWKKSTFLALALAYGANYTKEHYQTQQLMKQYCLEAKKYGDASIPDGVAPRSITVILNPSANKRKATKQFEKYCAPILHLAGVCVDVLLTESEGHARTLVENLKQTDAVVVAGGDGTVSEVITGLFRREDGAPIVENPCCPVGILPLGRTNTVGRVLFPGGETLANVRSLVEASMAIVKECTKSVDVMKIEIIEDPSEESATSGIEIETKNAAVDNSMSEVAPVNEPVPEAAPVETVPEEAPAEPSKPVYALATIEWGAYRDAYVKEDKYWYWGSLRKYATYIFSGYKKDLTWECNADVNYFLPCEGCSNCRVKPKQVPKRFWARFFSKPERLNNDYSKVFNEKCSERYSKEINTTDFVLMTENVREENAGSRLCVNVGPSTTGYVDFVSEGFKTLKGESRSIADTIQARQIEIVPKKTQNKEVWFSIDKEEYEVRPIRITLLPHVLKIFCRQT